MALGRRSRRSERAKLDATPPWSGDRVREQPDPTAGPYDEADAPVDQLERLDLGALRIPVVGGLEVRVDVGPDGQVTVATLSDAGSEMQLGVFAAPRNSGIWDDVRKEIRGSIASAGGTAQDARGPFGVELRGRVAVQGGYQPVRFVGVDGPRWFVRALFSGPAAADPVRAALLEEALRNLVIVRGVEPMPVRDPLPMQLPKEVAEQMGGQPASEPAAAPSVAIGPPAAPMPPPDPPPVQATARTAAPSAAAPSAAAPSPAGSEPAAGDEDGPPSSRPAAKAGGRSARSTRRRR